MSTWILDIHFYGNFGYWGYNYKNNLANLKQSKSIVPKGVYMIQTYFSLSDSDSDSWILDTICGSHIYNLLQQL